MPNYNKEKETIKQKMKLLQKRNNNYFGIIITTNFLKELLQKRNNNYIDFKSLCRLNNKITLKKNIADNQK